MTNRDDRSPLDRYAVEVAPDYQPNGVPADLREQRAPKAFDALRAVLDLHKPEQSYYADDDPVPGEQICRGCTDFRQRTTIYPCDTVRAIGEALR